MNDLFTNEEIRNYIAFVALFAPILLIFISERYKNQIVKTQKAERVGELFSFIPIIKEGSSLSHEETKRFNQLLNELALCLPFELVCDISTTLCIPENRGKYKDLLVKIRFYMYRPWRYRLSRLIARIDLTDGLKGENITHMKHLAFEKKI